MHRLAWKTQLLADLTERRLQQPVDFTTRDPAAMIAGVREWDAPEANRDRIRFSPITIRGRYDHARQVGVPTTKDGVAGWRIVTPLHLNAGDAPSVVVFVDRGFVARTSSTVDKPPGGVGADADVTVTGVVRPQARDSWFTPVPDSARRVSYSLDPQQLAKAAWPDATDVAGPIVGFTIAAEAEDPGPSGASLTRNPPRVDDIANRHLEYALTWFALAASLAGVAVVRLRRGRDRTVTA